MNQTVRSALVRVDWVLAVGWLAAAGLFAARVARGGFWWVLEDAFHSWALFAAPLALAGAARAHHGRALAAWLLPAPLWATLVYLARPPYPGESTSRLSLLPPAGRFAGIVFMYIFVAASTVFAVATLIRGRRARESRATIIAPPA